MLRKISLLLLLVVPTLFSFAQQSLRPVDSLSKIHFVIKNFGISTGGDLTGLGGEISFNKKNPAASSFNISVKTSTVDTDNSTRDKHLQKEEYFNAEKYPTITISGAGAKATTTGYLLPAKLSMKGVTKAIDIPFTMKQQGAGYLFEGNFELNRLDYKVGGESAVMGDIVKVTISVFAK